MLCALGRGKFCWHVVTRLLSNGALGRGLMINENLKIRTGSVDSYSSLRTRSPAMRGLVYGVLLSLVIWTGAGSLLLMLVFHGGGRPLQVTLANPEPHVGN